MKVNAFITIYNTRTKHMGDLSKEKICEIIKDIIKPIDYLPFDNKLSIVDYVIKQSMGAEYPTVCRYRTLITALISAYTNLECKDEDFDSLCSSKLLDFVINTFDSEYIFCNHLMGMCLSDLKGGDTYVIKSG